MKTISEIGIENASKGGNENDNKGEGGGGVMKTITNREMKTITKGEL
jgi:hypothetical protein